MNRTAVCLAVVLGALVLAGDAAGQPLPQGVRARVWSQSAGTVVGAMMGQLATYIVVMDQSHGACTQRVAESVQVWDDGALSVGQYYIPVECRAHAIVIPGSDVYRIDVSDGTNGATEIGRGFGFLAGLAAGYVAFAADGASTLETLAYGTAVGVPLGYVGSLIGAAFGAGFEREYWRRIR